MPSPVALRQAIQDTWWWWVPIYRLRLFRLNLYSMASRGVKHPTYIVRSRNVYEVHIPGFSFFCYLFLLSRQRPERCGFPENRFKREKEPDESFFLSPYVEDDEWPVLMIKVGVPETHLQLQQDAWCALRPTHRHWSDPMQHPNWKVGRSPEALLNHERKGWRLYSFSVLCSKAGCFQICYVDGSRQVTWLSDCQLQILSSTSSPLSYWTTLYLYLHTYLDWTASRYQ